MDRKVDEWTSSGCRQVAGAVAAARGLPSTILTTRSDESNPQGYRKVGLRIQRRVNNLIDRLWSSPLDSLSQLESANDVLLERLERNFSILEGRPILPITAPTIVQQQQTLIQSARSPLVSKSRVVRPQLLFKDPIDNTDSPWKPILKTKCNAIVPYIVDPIKDEYGNIYEYKHPYAVEIDSYNPPAQFLDDSLPDIESKESSQTLFQIINTEVELIKLVQHLNTISEIAIDLEHHSYRSFQGFTCLVQISTELGGDFIIDALALRDCLYRLNDPFTNPKILKVFHGADSDIIWLQRDFGVYVVGLFDTHRAAVRLGFPNKSLKYLLWKYCKKNTDKSLQLADWRVRPLPENLCEYARDDTHSLLYIWRCIRKELIEAENGNVNRLLSVFEDSKLVCLKTYTKPKLEESTTNELIRKSGKYFNSRQKTALNTLLIWRDEIARQEDESTGYVLPNHMILQIAENLPKETAGILACCLPTPPLVLHHLNTIYQMIVTARIKPLIEEKPEATIEEIILPVKSIHIYNHQLLNVPSEPTNLVETIRKLKNLKCTSSRGSLLSSSEEEPKTVENVNHFKFMPPFHRLLLVKKYNEITHKNNDSIKQKNIPSNENEVSTNFPMTNSVKKTASDDDNDDNSGDDDIAITKLEDYPVIKFNKTVTSNRKSDVEKKLTGPVTVRKPEKRKIETNEKEFKPFNIESFDYSVYNKNSFQHKKKRKFNKRK